MEKSEVEALHITKVAVNDALLSGSIGLDEAKAHITEVAIAANLKVDNNPSNGDTTPEEVPSAPAETLAAPVADEGVVADDTVADGDVITDETPAETPVVDEDGIEIDGTGE